MKKAQKILKLAGPVLLLATVGYALFMKLTDEVMFDLYVEYFFRAITPLNILFWLTAAVLVLGNLGAVAESLRKMMVSLKRRPSTIPLVMLAIAFVYYSLNLTKMSNTTALVYGAGMGLSQFVIMLFTALAIVCMLNAFPKRQKANLPMVALMFGMLGVNIYCALHYRDRVFHAVTREVSPIDTVRNPFVVEAYDMLMVYIILVAIVIGLVLLLPLYSRLLRKINTSVEVEYNSDMGVIEISE